jgi:hypothetical protein
MDAHALTEQVEHLQQLASISCQHKALAQALAQRARHLGHVSRNYEADDIVLLRDVANALANSGMLRTDEASKLSKFLENRSADLQEDHLLRLGARSLHSGISGQPLAKCARQLGTCSKNIASSASELQSMVCLLHKSGLLSKDESEDQLHQLGNRMSELKECEPSRTSKCVSWHSGLSTQELRQRTHRLQCVAQNLKRTASQLRSSVQVFHSLGFIANDEAEQYFHSFDILISDFASHAEGISTLLHSYACTKVIRDTAKAKCTDTSRREGHPIHN